MHTNFVTVRITKIEVAKRQLEHALKVFLAHGDFVIVHHCAAAAHEILTVLAKPQGAVSIIYDGIDKLVKPGKKKEVKARFAKAKNYFKHAAKDPHQQLEFKPELSTHFLIDAISLYQAITGELTTPMLAYRAWYFVEHQDWLTDAKSREVIADLALNLPSTNRGAFLEAAAQLEQ